MKSIAVILAVTLSLVIIVEAGARIMLWAPTSDNPSGHIRVGINASTLGDHHPHQNGIFTFEFLEWPYHVKTNTDGFRNSADIRDTPVLILALGDSFTFGAFVDTHDTWTSWLEHYLNTAFGNDQVQILNNGVSGTSVVDQADYMEQKGTNVGAKIVILGTTANDIREVDEGYRTFGYVRRHSIAQDRELAFGNIRDFLGRHVAVYTLAKALKDNFIKSERSAGQDTSNILPPTNRDHETAAIQFVQAANGKSTRSYITPYRQMVADSQQFDVTLFDAYAENFRRLRRAVDAANARLIVVYLPMQHDMTESPIRGFHARFIQELTRDTQTQMVDLTEAMEQYPFEDILNLRDRDATGTYPNEGHYSRFGNIQVARALQKPVQRMIENLNRAAMTSAAHPR